MSKVLIEEQTLYGVGNAIREHTGESTTYKPGEMPNAIRLAFDASSQSDVTRILMTSVMDVYLYSGGTRGWESGTDNATGSETFYADIPDSHKNGGYILLATSRPSGQTWEFTRDRIGFTDGNENPQNLPTGITDGITTAPEYYLNAMSASKDKQFTLCKVPNGMSRVYWTNTQAPYRTPGQASYMYLLDSIINSAIGFDWYYSLRNSSANNAETAVLINRD